MKVPAALVNYVYVDPDQWQTYITRDSPYYAGKLRKPVAGDPPLPLDVRKIIARRSLLEFKPGYICNLGFGISQLIGRVAWEEGITDQLVLTVEQGIFGGVPVAGNEGGAGFNYQALIDQPDMFGFYDGGGLDIASLSFAEVDTAGNVNVQGLSNEQRATIERIALNYLGPIAALLCDEALGVPGSIDRALVQIASNLPARDQEDQFLAEARGALGLRS